MFPKKNKLKSKQFSSIYSTGIKLKGRYGMLIYSPISNNLKLGIVVNSKIGNAVKRNKMTRRIRSIFRDMFLKNNFTIQAEYILFNYVDDYKALKIDIENIVKKIR